MLGSSCFCFCTCLQLYLFFPTFHKHITACPYSTERKDSKETAKSCIIEQLAKVRRHEAAHHGAKTNCFCNHHPRTVYVEQRWTSMIFELCAPYQNHKISSVISWLKEWRRQMFVYEKICTLYVLFLSCFFFKKRELAIKLKRRMNIDWAKQQQYHNSWLDWDFNARRTTHLIIQLLHSTIEKVSSIVRAMVSSTKFSFSFMNH